MKLIRLTSVFLCCVLLSSFLILPVSAADDSNYYSFPAVGASEPSLAVEWPVNPVSGEYNSILNIIAGNQNTQTSYLSSIYSYLTGLADWRNGLSNDVSSSASLLSSIFSSLSAISDKVATETTLSAISDKVATETTLSAFNSAFSSFFRIWKYNYDQNTWVSDINSDGSFVLTNWKTMQVSLFNQFIRDTVAGSPDQLTVRGAVKRLQETLASEDDRQLAENYKDNRKQAETDFLNGKSGKTSLGKDDFGSLSSVGGTFHDISSLNGQASIGDLTSGLSDADTVGQGWFSKATKDSLDAVSGSGSSESTVSTFSDDGLYSVDTDPDPYHMQGFEDNYAWLWGDD